MKPLKSLDTNGWSKKDLVREAQLQTNAIQQLSAWLRLACSLLVIGIIVLIGASRWVEELDLECWA